MSGRLLSQVQLFKTLRTVARQASLSMEFSRQEYWSGLPFPPPRDLLDPEEMWVEPEFPALTGGFSFFFFFFLTRPSFKVSFIQLQEISL